MDVKVDGRSFDDKDVCGVGGWLKRVKGYLWG